MAKTTDSYSTKPRASKSVASSAAKKQSTSKNFKPINTASQKTQAELAHSKTKEELYADERRHFAARIISGFILGFLALFLFLSFFMTSGSFLQILRYAVTGFFGIGYFLFPFSFLYIIYILIVKYDQPAALRIFCVLMTDFLFAALFHTVREPAELTESLLKYLWKSGQSMVSGGVLPGLFAHIFRLLVSRPGAFAVCFILLLLCVWKGFDIKLAKYLNRKANRKREAIKQAQENSSEQQSEVSINTWDDLKVIATPVPASKERRSSASASREISDEERASFNVPVGDDPVKMPAGKAKHKINTATEPDYQNYQMFVQPDFPSSEKNRRKAFDVDIGAASDVPTEVQSNHTSGRSRDSDVSGQMDFDDLLLFSSQRCITPKKSTDISEPVDMDLPFSKSGRRKITIHQSKSKNNWDIPLGNPVDSYTAQVQSMVRSQSDIKQKQEAPFQKPASRKKDDINTSTDTFTYEPTLKVTAKEDVDSEISTPVAHVMKASFEEADPAPSSIPVIASPTESEIEAGAKQAKKSGSMNKGEADAAEALVSLEIAEGDSSDSAPQYHFPPMQILTEARSSEADNTAEMREKVLRLEATLKSFGIDIKVENVVRGPSVTRYEMELKPGTKMSRITSLNEDIALSLGVASVRVAAVPGKSSTIGIEVPNTISTSVPIRSVIDSKEFSKAKSNLAFAVGKDISGEIIIGDIAKMPHLLIAGTTGSGKSVCMNSIIVSLLYRTKPEQCRMIMIDPKVVELSVYNGIPHLLIPVVTDAKKAAGALQWAVTEMERRYNLLAEYNVRDLAGYNKQAAQRTDIQPLPQIVVIIDELADLMLVAAKEVENSIVRIAQKARAAGMHLVIATQRPSANVITGLMKANIPSRIAFAVSSAIDSRIILDTGGAEKLLGKGDMLFAPIGSGSPKRVQGCFITDDEVESVVNAVKEVGSPDYDDSISATIENSSTASGSDENSAVSAAENYEGDPQFAEAVEVVLDTKQASVSMLQRRLRLGYAHAARIVDEMEEKGIVGPFEGSKPRQLLITRDQWNSMTGINPNASVAAMPASDIEIEPEDD